MSESRAKVHRRTSRAVRAVRAVRATLLLPLVGAAVVAAAPSSNASAATVALPSPIAHSLSFADTGSAQYFTVPAGVSSVTLTLDGAAGGAGQGTSVNTHGGAGGAGARVVATKPVFAGQQLRVEVGGVGQVGGDPYGAGLGGSAGGGASNGGTGGYGDGNDTTTGGSGGGGGAATEVDLLGNPVIGTDDQVAAVAGGGGGGAGSGAIVLYNGGPGGAGGRPASGGTGGTGPGAGGGGYGGASSRVYGDNGGSSPWGSQGGGGGGGGGGYSPFGGGAGTGGGAGVAGAGGGGGAGGGMSFAQSTAATFGSAPTNGNGAVTVAWTTASDSQTVVANANSVTAGTSVTFTDTVTGSDPTAPAPTGTVSVSGPGLTAPISGTLTASSAGSSRATITAKVPAGTPTGGSVYAFRHRGDGRYPAGATSFVETVVTAGADLNRSSLAFGTDAVGSRSVRALTVTSGGTAPLAVSGALTTGASFRIVGNTCTGHTLARGKTCMISVQYQPNRAGGSTGHLVVTDNAPDSPQQVPLTGTAK